MCEKYMKAIILLIILVTIMLRTYGWLACRVPFKECPIDIDITYTDNW